MFEEDKDVFDVIFYVQRKTFDNSRLIECEVVIKEESAMSLKLRCVFDGIMVDKGFRR